MPINPDGSPSDALQAIQKQIHNLFIATVILYGIVLLIVIGVGIIAVISFTQSKNNHDALCAYRGDLQQRVADTEDFLLKHPKGLPKLGLTASQLQQGVQNQLRTISALDSLNCDESTTTTTSTTVPLDTKPKEQP